MKVLTQGIEDGRVNLSRVSNDKSSSKIHEQSNAPAPVSDKKKEPNMSCLRFSHSLEADPLRDEKMKFPPQFGLVFPRGNGNVLPQLTDSSGEDPRFEVDMVDYTKIRRIDSEDERSIDLEKHKDLVLLDSGNNAFHVCGDKSRFVKGALKECAPMFC